jgi:PAS domain S-box-containing protein
MDKKKIMIVEDEGIVAKALQNKLLKFGFDCNVICHTGEDAVEKSKESKPDLILMDIFLKGKMDGIEAAECIGKNSDIPIIYLTAYANDETLERAKITHPFGYILKPYKEKDLQVAIEMSLYKHKLDSQIKASEARYREVIDTSQIAIVSTDGNDKIILWNLGAKQIFGYKPEEIKLKKVNELITYNIEQEVSINPISNILMHTLGENEAIGYHQTGKLLILDISKSTRLENEQTITTYFMRDITEKKKSDAQLHHHKEHLKLINRIMRHDLSTQLSIMRSSVKLYKVRKEAVYLDGVEESINSSIQLIRKMRDLEFYLSSHTQLQIYNIRESLLKVLERNFELEIEVRGNCSVLADDAIYSVFENIIFNARKHGKATQMVITISEKGRLCEIRFADNGSGVPDEIKEQIFEENFTYGDEKHTGIGLYIVKKALENYSGAVYVENNEPRGAVFVVILRTISDAEK